MKITMDDSRSLSCGGTAAGYEGEHGSPTLEFELPPEYAAMSARAEFESPGGRKSFLPLEGGAVALPSSLTARGQLRVQLVFEDGGNIYKSGVLRLDFSPSIGALDEAAQESQGGLAGLEERIAGRVSLMVPPGAKGDRGEKGEKGDRGNKGDPGDPASFPGGYFLCADQNEIDYALSYAESAGTAYIKLVGAVEGDIMTGSTGEARALTIDGYGATLTGGITVYGGAQVTVAGVECIGDISVQSAGRTILRDCSAFYINAYANTVITGCNAYAIGTSFGGYPCIVTGNVAVERVYVAHGISANNIAEGIF